MFDPYLLATIATLTGMNAGQFVRKYFRLLKKESEDLRREKLANRFEVTRQIVSAGLHTEALGKLYPCEDLKKSGLSRICVLFEGKRIPTTIVGRRTDLQIEIELKESSEEHKIVDVPALPNLDPKVTAEIYSDILERRLEVWDDRIYRPVQLRIENCSLKGQFALERFLKYRLGLGALWDELLQGVIDSDCDVEKLVRQYHEHLPLRSMFLPDGESIATYGSRMCLAGIHAVVAIERPKPWSDFAIPVQTRAGKVSEGQNLITPIPTAFHQPMVDPQKELRFAQTFYRELYEEVFGGKEAIRGSRHLRHDWYMESSPALKWLKRHSQHHRLICTGLGLNLLNGNYEVALLCVIQNPSFWDEYGHMLVTNWETSEAVSPLLSTKDDVAIRRILSRNDWTGPGLYSVGRGLSYLQQKEPSRFDIPEIKGHVE